MKVNMDKVKIVRFAVANRLKGYRLLKNPKGSSPYDAVMIKTFFGIHDSVNDNVDKVFHITRRHLKKEGDKFVKEERLLMTKYYMNPETMSYSGKNKEVAIGIEKKPNYKYSEKQTMTDAEIENRKCPEWWWSECKFAFEEKLFNENTSRIGGFWKTLISNLKGGV